MKVLVSGATGLVGRYVVDGLLAAGHAVTAGGRAAPAADLPFRPLVLDPALDQRDRFAGIDAFIHLAFDHLPGRYRGGEGDDPQRFRSRNHDGSVKLFRDARDAGIRRCIFLSSRAVYDGIPPARRLTEDVALAPNSLYGHIKMLSEQALADLSSDTFVATSLRATGVYGHHRPNKWDGLFADWRAGKPVASRAGTEVHGDDLAAAVRLVLETYADAVNGRSFNVSDIVTDTHEILALYGEAGGLRLPLPAPADRTPVRAMETARLAALGWQPGGRPRLQATLQHLSRETGMPSR